MSINKKRVFLTCFGLVGVGAVSTSTVFSTIAYIRTNDFNLRLDKLIEKVYLLDNEVNMLGKQVDDLGKKVKDAFIQLKKLQDEVEELKKIKSVDAILVLLCGKLNKIIDVLNKWQQHMTRGYFDDPNIPTKCSTTDMVVDIISEPTGHAIGE